MAILSSTKSRRRASSNPQVPLVIISQPLPGPITGQSSPATQAPLETANQSDADGAAAASADPVFKVSSVSTKPDESPSPTHVTSLPVDISEDTPTAGEEPTVIVSLFSIITSMKKQQIKQFNHDARSESTLFNFQTRFSNRRPDLIFSCI